MISDLAFQLGKEFPFYKQIEKKTQNTIDYGNVCVNCGAYQGDFFIVEELLELAYEQEKLKDRKFIEVDLNENERYEYAFPFKINPLNKFRKKGDRHNGLYLCEKCRFAII
jgi:hypothetical protein